MTTAAFDDLRTLAMALLAVAFVGRLLRRALHRRRWARLAPAVA